MTPYPKITKVGFFCAMVVVVLPVELAILVWIAVRDGFKDWKASLVTTWKKIGKEV